MCVPSPDSVLSYPTLPYSPLPEEVIAGEDLLLDVQSEECAFPSKRGIEILDAEGKLAPEKSRKNLFAILSAVYIRHGNAAAIAIAGRNTEREGERESDDQRVP